LGRFLLWLTFINRGPHKAYKIVSAYNNEYGDFYEDARDIAKLRENEKALLGSKTEKEGVRDQLTAIGSRMDTLDGSYRGPDGIARDVAGIVAREVKDDPAFAAALCQAVPGDETRTAALSAIKIRAFDRVKSFLNTELEQVKATLTDLRRPLDNLQNALGRVGGNNIYYDVDDAESAINRGVRVTREAVRDAEGAREAIAGYEVRGTTFNADRAENEINRYADLNARGNEIDLDFSDLERKVDNEVEDYEREQARIREQQRLARERAAAEARAAREALERLNSRRSTPTASIDFGSSSRSSSSGGLSRGTGGIASRSNDSVSRGTSGIKPRI
jgi:hypothetical protein